MAMHVKKDSLTADPTWALEEAIVINTKDTAEVQSAAQSKMPGKAALSMLPMSAAERIDIGRAAAAAALSRISRSTGPPLALR